MMSRTSGQRINRSRAKRKPAAFTLVELLLVITLVGLIVATLAPQVGSSLRSWQLRGSAGRVAGMLKALRLRAKQEQAPMCFILNPKAKSYRSGRVNSSQDEGFLALNDPMLAKQQLPAEMEFADLAGFLAQDQEHYLVFTPLGRSQASSVLVRAVKNPGKQAIQIETEEDGTVKLTTINPSPQTTD